MFLSYSTGLTAFIALAVAVGLIILAGRLARSTGLARGNANARLTVKASMPIDKNRSLRIVSCDDREFLLLVGGGNDLLLGWLPGPER